MAETPEQLFAKLMPGYDLSKAKRTPEGYPYIEETAEFEPGTFGQRSEGRPLVRLSPKADKYALPHELAHVKDLYEGTKYPEYDEQKMTNLYQTYGLSPDEASGLAYGMAPHEVAARRASGDPGKIFQDLLARVEALKARRLGVTKPPAKAPAGGGIAGARYAQ
jgi:hypothetical protein